MSWELIRLVDAGRKAVPATWKDFMYPAMAALFRVVFGSEACSALVLHSL